MKTLIISSSFTFYYKNEQGVKIPQKIDNNNGFLDNLQKILTKRDCCLIISGKPKKEHDHDPSEINRQGFALSGIGFKEFIYVNDKNKHNIKEYIKKADCINLCGGHLPMCNDFINELNLRELIKDFNGVIIGASGGGMNMADCVYCIPEVEGEHIDPTFNRYLKGLALTNVNIVPHYNYFKTDVFSDGTRMVEDILLKDSYNSPLIAIPDGSYIIQKGSEKTLYGEAYLLENGNIKQICENGKLIKI